MVPAPFPDKARITELPPHYVRKGPKGVGRYARIEGSLIEGGRVLLVEDPTTDSQSRIKLCDVSREVGAVILHTFVVFFCGVFSGTQ